MALWHDESAEELAAELKRIEEEMCEQEMDELGAYGISKEYIDSQMAAADDVMLIQDLSDVNIVSQEEMANQLLTWNGSNVELAATFTIAEPIPPTFTFFAENSDELVRIEPDGSVHFGENYTPDAAAESFWMAMARKSPFILEAHIEELERQIGKLQVEKEVLEYHLKDADGEKQDGALDDMVVIREPVNIPARHVSMRIRNPKKVKDEEAFDKAMKVVE